MLLNPSTSAVQRIISLQYNPDTLTRTLQVQGIGGEGGNRSKALRLKGSCGNEKNGGCGRRSRSTEIS